MVTTNQASDFYKISPTEYEDLLKSKREEKRINRLVKVRQATKSARSMQKQKYLTTKNQKESERNEALRRAWEQEKELKIQNLKRQLMKRKEMAGTAMQVAGNQNERKQQWASEAFWQFHKDEEIKKTRGNHAVLQTRELKRNVKEEVQQQRREMVRMVESERKDWVIQETPYCNQENIPLDPSDCHVNGEFYPSVDYLRQKTQQLLSNLNPKSQQETKWENAHRDYTKTRFHDRPDLVASDRPPSVVQRANPEEFVVNARDQAHIMAERTQTRLNQQKLQQENTRIAAIKRARDAYQKIQTAEMTENVNEHLGVMQEANIKRRMREIGSRYIRTEADEKLLNAKQRDMEKDFESMLL
uniref:Uncharacterized protein n=1 Tax=Percolomonas cosmopolitus TaxID=63605 RepID=A0A7S1KP27_9EUKA|mmetsp:Transcript_353/g.1317  ORF Transcript_353/g.1317 Transcript_353/m.1317 type:complete len:358 (+) Transcript_353:90-1163(+)